MADRRARTSSLPEDNRVRQKCPFAHVTPGLEASLEEGGGFSLQC